MNATTNTDTNNGSNGNDRDKSNKIKTFMGRTPSVIKSKFLSVLGNSSDIINDISNKIDAALSLTSSSEAETTANRNQTEVDNMLKRQYRLSNHKNTDRVDVHIIDFAARRVKERRAHEEVLSGRYRQPTFVASTPEIETAQICAPTSNSGSTDISIYSNSYSIDSKSPQPPLELECDLSDFNRRTTPVDIIVIHNKEPVVEVKKGVPSSASTSDNESYLQSATVESTDLKMWIRSESENSVPSWASSISLDSQSEEAILEFMRRFVNILFRESSSITLEIKSEFGQCARTENGRLWFARLVNAQRVKSKRVDESTFYSLVQYFAIVLFECGESDDFSPAKSLMNMCFTFYHNIDVPGCEPYREYLYTYLRDQPIWHTLRFWNAAFFDALQCERVNRPVPPTKLQSKLNNTDTLDSNSLAINENDLSSSSSAYDKSEHSELFEDKKFQQNISFGQLGSFTCNMHAFGLSRELCTEFLKKQCTIGNLNREQEKLLEDNVNRMYRETDPWRES